jgi:hypothetical protein
MKKILALLIFIAFASVTQGQTTLVPFNSSWKYLDNESNKDTAWRSTTTLLLF